MEPIFARLGVKHEARNFGNPGLGTLHNTMGLGSIYGPDLDCLIWDGEYTEPDDDRAVDVLARQAILGGLKVPLLWNLRPNVSATLETMANVHVGQFGTTVPPLGIPTTTTQGDEMNQTIWAARFLNCGTNETLRATLCRPHEFNGTCWLPRSDFRPTKKAQADSLPHSKLSSADSDLEDYPGFRHHQLRGRTIAFTLLQALEEVLTLWANAEDLVLPDEVWHVSDYYETTRAKVRSLDPMNSGCGLMEDHGLGFLCNYPFQVCHFLLFLGSCALCV
jgi:hypothetical protein